MNTVQANAAPPHRTETSESANALPSDGHHALTAKASMDAQARVADPHVLTAEEGNLPEAHSASAVSTRMKVRHALAEPAAWSGIA